MASRSRLALAQEIAGELRRGEGRNLVAVGVYGSAALGKDREFSDVDLLVVVRRKRPSLGPLVRDGILVTILQMTPDEAADEVRGARSGLGEALGGWRSMRSVHDPTGLLARLRRRAWRPSPSQFRDAAIRAILETYEDYGKLLNAIASGDRDEMREMAIWFTGAAHMAVFDLAEEVVPTGRRAFVELTRHGALGRDIRSLRYARHGREESLRLANRIWEGIRGRARQKGIPLPEFGSDGRAGSL